MNGLLSTTDEDRLTDFPSHVDTRRITVRSPKHLRVQWILSDCGELIATRVSDIRRLATNPTDAAVAAAAAAGGGRTADVEISRRSSCMKLDVGVMESGQPRAKSSPTITCFSADQRRRPSHGPPRAIKRKCRLGLSVLSRDTAYTRARDTV